VTMHLPCRPLFVCYGTLDICALNTTEQYTNVLAIIVKRFKKLTVVMVMTTIKKRRVILIAPPHHKHANIDRCVTDFRTDSNTDLQ
jgi:hypothetical protein